MIRLTMVTVLLMVAQPSFAQEAAVHSFDQLTVKPGQAIHLQPVGEKTRAWRVVSLTSDQIAVKRVRWNVRTERRIFTEQSVRRIKAQDSTVDGLLIGTGVGVLGLFAFGSSSCQDPDCILLAALAVSMGPILGTAIDLAINRTIYAATRGTTVTISPLLGRNRLGVAAQIRLGSFH